MKTIYTIGYATKSLDEFLLCLKNNGITSVVDVRSSPFSAAFPAYNRDSLKALLQSNSIYYLSFAEEFGARRAEQEVYAPSFDLKTEKSVRRVSFEKTYELEAFQRGVRRIEDAYAKGQTVCFMCSEKHPSDCHRFLMVAAYFKRLGYEVINIVSANENWTYDRTMEQVALNYQTEKERFYRKHPNVGQQSLFGNGDTQFEIYWDDFYASGAPNEEQLLRFGNRMIGYAEGGESDD